MSTAGEPKSATVVVGASRGIGRAIAKVAAGDRGPVVLIARSLDGLTATASDVREAGGEPYMLELDLFSADAPAQLYDFLASNNLDCDVLVNSAGYAFRGAATTLSMSDQLGMIDVNVRALSDLTLRFLPGMIARRRGGVINLSSIAGFTPGPNMAIYYASKSFVRSFSEALHQELRHTGVIVTCVAPGPVDTEFLARSGAERVALFKIFPRVTSQFVAEHAWRGFKAGRRLVIPGVSAKLAALTASVLPSVFLLPVIHRLQRRRNDPCPCGSGLRFSECCGKGGMNSSRADRPNR